MRVSGKLALVVALAFTLAASDAWAQRGRGGRGGRPGPGAISPGGGAARPGMGSIQRPAGNPSPGMGAIQQPGSNAGSGIGAIQSNPHPAPSGMGAIQPGSRPGGGQGPAVHGSWPSGRSPVQNPNGRAGGAPPSGHGWQPGQPGWRNQAGSRQAQWNQWQTQANQVRGNLQNRYNNLFTPQWYRDHPNAWKLTHPHADAWAVASAAAMAAWIGVATAPGYGYGYGDTVIYEGDTVYINGEEVASAEEYAVQASQLADAGATTSNQQNWMPVGVFALAGNGQPSTDRLLQLALAQDGTVGGAYYDALTNQDLPVQGSVDPKTGRVAWTVGKNRQTVMETDLNNLSKAETPVLVHFGDNNTQKWLLVRLNAPAQQANQQ
ncbi:MAG: hypothetical protein JW818_01015 [Pirellulales bacterium]|nr:hypothetical protein [Pirellulales bacterium]